MKRFLLSLALCLVSHAQPFIGRAFLPLNSGVPGPQSINHIRLYWNYLDISTNNAPISGNWLDRIQGYGLGQATAANQPTNTPFGVRFTGTAGYYLTNQPTFEWVDNGAADQGAIWVAYFPLNQSAATGRMINDTSNYGLDATSVGALNYEGEVGSNPRTFGGFYPTAILNTLAINITEGSTNAFYTNTVLSLGPTTSGQPANAQTYVGWDASGVDYFAGYILEMAWFSNQLSAAEMTILHNYATNQYGATTNCFGVSNPMVAMSAYSPGSALNNFTGGVGFKFLCTAPLTVTSLGRWKIAGNSQTHTVRIRNSSGTSVASVSVDLSGGSAGAFNYADLLTPYVLTPGQTYYILSDETNGGDQWYNDTGGGVSVTYSDEFKSLLGLSRNSAYYDGTVNTGTGLTYGPTNFKFTCP